MLRTADKRLFTSGQLSDIGTGEFQPVPSRREVSLPVTTGLAAWWDASDKSTITDAGSGAVSAWADKSGNGWTATEATNRPTTGTRTINGLNGLDFDGSNDVLSASLPSDDFTSTVFAVCEVDNLGSIRTIIGANNTGGLCMRLLNTSGNIQVEKQGIAAILNSAVGTSVSTPMIVSVNLPTSVVRISRGLLFANSQQATHAQTPTAGRTTQIASSAGALFFDGIIGEILVYNVSLSRTDDSLVVGYLSSKWGITG